MELSEENLTSSIVPLQKYGEKESEDDIRKFYKTLEKKLENCRENGIILSKNFKDAVENQQFNITGRYVSLQETDRELQRNINLLEVELNNLKIDMIADMKKLSFQYEDHKRVQEELGKAETTKIQEQIDRSITEHNEKVQNLWNELELAQATSALQHDDVDTELRKEIVDINMKIRQMQGINNGLKREIDVLTSRQKQLEIKNSKTTPENIFENAERPKVFENIQVQNVCHGLNDVVNSEHQPQVATENVQENYIQLNKNFKQNYINNDKNTNNNSSNLVELEKINTPKKIININNISKYEPLPFLNFKSNTFEKRNDNVISEKTKGHKHRNNSKKFGNYTDQSMSSDSNSNNCLANSVIGDEKMPKRRKLFDPDNLEYLNILAQED